MARLITVTKVGYYDKNGSYFAEAGTTRVYDTTLSAIETHTSGASIYFASNVKFGTTEVSGLVVSQTPAQIQTLFDASVSTVNPVVNVSADGAITIPSVNTTYYCTKAGVAAMTIGNPTATTHDGLRLTFIATTAQANTLSNAAGAGFNDGGASHDVGTFGGAKGDNIVIEAYQGKWYVVSKVNVTLA